MDPSNTVSLAEHLGKHPNFVQGCPNCIMLHQRIYLPTVPAITAPQPTPIQNQIHTVQTTGYQAQNQLSKQSVPSAPIEPNYSLQRNQFCPPTSHVSAVQYGGTAAQSTANYSVAAPQPAAQTQFIPTQQTAAPSYPQRVAAQSHVAPPQQTGAVSYGVYTPQTAQTFGTAAPQTAVTSHSASYGVPAPQTTSNNAVTAVPTAVVSYGSNVQTAAPSHSDRVACFGGTTPEEAAALAKGTKST